MVGKSDTRDGAVLIVGLGRFGTSLARTLVGLDREVLGVDIHPVVVAKWANHLPVIEADATNPDALDQVGAADFPVAVVSIATSLEGSVLATGNLVDIGIDQIWAKASTSEHGRILRRIGAHHVVYPESDAGQRVAHMVSGRIIDFIEMDDGFAVIKVRAPRETWDKTIDQINPQRKFGVRIIGLKSPRKSFEYSLGDSRISAHDVLIVSGGAAELESFAHRP